MFSPSLTGTTIILFLIIYIIKKVLYILFAGAKLHRLLQLAKLLSLFLKEKGPQE
jgi:hypothetical protein